MMWNQERNIAFVEEVKKHKVIYDFTDSNYNIKSVTERAWQTVSAKVHMPVLDCKEKWRNIRTVFIRRMKYGSGASNKAYYLMDTMQFCIPYIKALEDRDVPPPAQSSPAQSKRSLPMENQSTSKKGKLETSIDRSQSHVRQMAIKIKQEHQKLQEPTPDRIHVRKMMPRSRIETPKSKLEVRPVIKETSKISASNKSAESSQKKSESIKMFLLSVMPELEELSDNQIKLFKRTMLDVIDDVSKTSKTQYSSFVTMLSSKSGSSENSSHNMDPLSD